MLFRVTLSQIYDSIYHVNDFSPTICITIRDSMKFGNRLQRSVRPWGHRYMFLKEWLFSCVQSKFNRMMMTLFLHSGIKKTMPYEGQMLIVQQLRMDKRVFPPLILRVARESSVLSHRFVNVHDSK